MNDKDYDRPSALCEGCEDDEEEEENEKLGKVLIIVGAVLLVLSFLPFLGSFVRDACRILCAVLCGYPTAITAFKGLKNKRMNEAFLMTVAVIAAIVIEEYFEAAAVALLFRVGEALEDYARERSKRSLEEIFSIVPDKGRLVLEDGGFEEIGGDDIKVGMLLAVFPHEKVPADGVITRGSGTMDVSAITGESIPVEVCEGSSIMSGSINGDTTIYYEVTAAKSESAAARIVALVKDASEQKSETQRFTDRFAKYYTPIVVGAAVVYGIVCAIITKDISLSLHRALVLVVASCPCAIVLSVPLAFISSMGAAAKNGIIIKGSSFIESLAAADTAVFDKTGTVTSDVPAVGKIHALPGYDEQQVLYYAAISESHSSHPLAKAVMAAYGEAPESSEYIYEEAAGGGTAVSTPMGRICAGGEMLMKREGVDVSALPNAQIYISLDGKAIGGIECISELKENAVLTVNELKKIGIKNTVMLTGDSEKNALPVCEKLGIEDCRSSLSPADKLSETEKIRKDSKTGIIYVGDGINDAPVITLADTGVAMGLGTQAASEAADVILADSQIAKLYDAVSQSKRTMKVLKSNIAFSLVFKLAVIALGIIGIAPLWLAVVADVGTMLVCVIRSAQLLKIQSIVPTVKSEIRA